MKDILFRPFDIQKWFILGFSAWLAVLGEGGGSNGGSSFDGSDFGLEDENGSSALATVTTWIQENLALILTIGAILFLIVTIIGVAILWVQSRGKFMFFDNVIHNRTRITEPWKQFREVANSLFWWKLVFGLILLTSFLGLAGWLVYLLWPMAEAESFDPDIVPSLVVIGSLFLLIMLAFSYIAMLLESFVIPLMHQDGTPVTAAWRKILALHREQPFHFIGFYLWSFLIGLLSGLAILLLIVGTCCIAAIPLIIPYLGTVLLLPLYVFTRLLGPEFLQQFGSDYDTLSIGEKPPLPLN